MVIGKLDIVEKKEPVEDYSHLSEEGKKVA